MDKKKPSARLVKRILFLSANPQKKNLLNLDQECREISEGLKRAERREEFELRPAFSATFWDIRRALLEFKPHIVHFSGHGDEEGLLIEGRSGLPEKISADVLSSLFRLCARYVGCVVLNACYSFVQAAAISEHIRYVIGMQKKIDDRASIEFSVAFYDSMGAGKSVEEAFEFSRNAIQYEHPGGDEHFIPLLLKRREEWRNMRLFFETTGKGFDYRADISENTAVFKDRLIEHLKFAIEYEDGKPVIYCLRSKNREAILNDNLSLRDNAVQEQEVLGLLIQLDNL